jgi:uncharacterized membrane protein YbhN (UPF0104 family)
MFRKALSFTLLAGFLSWSTWYIYTNSGDFIAITQLEFPDVLLLAFIFLLILLCNGLFISVVSSAFQLQLRSIEWFSLSAASSFANYFLPFRGGAGLRALYMSRLHKFPLTGFISTLSVMYLMHIAVNGVLALIGMALIKLDGRPTDTTVLAFYTLVSLLGCLAVTCKFSIGNNHRKFPLKQLQQILQGWEKVRQDRPLQLRLWLIMLLMTAATVWQCQVAFEAISTPLSGGGILVYAASKNLAMLISLTPGSLGIVEVISIYLGNLLGYSTSDALLVQGLIRSVAITMLLLIGPAALLFLKRQIETLKPSIPGTSIT